MLSPGISGSASVNRRTLLVLAAGAAVATVPVQVLAQGQTLVAVERFSVSGDSLGSVSVPMVVKTGAEWRQRLPPESYAVLRQAATEPPFHNAYDENHADGLYRCLGCDNALFDSHTKFDSRTGWPSFWRPISSENVVEHTDLSDGMHRIAIACTLCAGHLGHVFHDGPAPTHLRYCMNSAALKFVARAAA